MLSCLNRSSRLVFLHARDGQLPESLIWSHSSRGRRNCAFWCFMLPVGFRTVVSGSDLHAVTIMYNFKWLLYCVLIAKCIMYKIWCAAPSQLCLRMKFLRWLCTTTHPQQEVRSHIHFTLKFKFHLKPIRGAICDCQRCLAITWAKRVFLHRLIKRHYCSLMSSSPWLSVGCVYYNFCPSFLPKSTACRHLLTSSAAMLWTITAHST